jgi:hypothetical protein
MAVAIRPAGQFKSLDGNAPKTIFDELEKVMRTDNHPRILPNSELEPARLGHSYLCSIQQSQHPHHSARSTRPRSSTLIP